jgi:hypothetical protein
MFLWLLVLLSCLAACAPSRSWCERSYGPCGQVLTELKYRDSIVHLPGATVRDTISEIKFTERERIVVRTDSTGKTQLRYWRDAYGRLWAECRTKNDSTRIRWVERTKTQVLVPPRPPKNVAVPWIIAGASLLALGIALFWGRLKRFV